MSAHSEWKRVVKEWRSGRINDEPALRATATYLHESANWIEVRDFLINMAWTKKQILDWFGDQDFPDFEQAVEDGWGWPEEMEEDFA